MGDGRKRVNTTIYIYRKYIYQNLISFIYKAVQIFLYKILALPQ